MSDNDYIPDPLHHRPEDLPMELKDLWETFIYRLSDQHDDRYSEASALSTVNMTFMPEEFTKYIRVNGEKVPSQLDSSAALREAIEDIVVKMECTKIAIICIKDSYIYEHLLKYYQFATTVRQFPIYSTEVIGIEQDRDPNHTYLDKFLVVYPLDGPHGPREDGKYSLMELTCRTIRIKPYDWVVDEVTKVIKAYTDDAVDDNECILVDRVDDVIRMLLNLRPHLISRCGVKMKYIRRFPYPSIDQDLSEALHMHELRRKYTDETSADDGPYEYVPEEEDPDDWAEDIKSDGFESTCIRRISELTKRVQELESKITKEVQL